MELPVRNMQGDAVGTVEVSDYLFAVPMNTAVVHQAMVMQQANGRRGTSSTKTRAQVSGGGAKPRPQKGTGRARQGSIRAPHFRGGGIVFGPHVRSYRQRMPKKMRRLAIRCLLSEKVREERLAVLEELHLPQPKTQEMRRLLETLQVSSTALVVSPGVERTVVLSARNLQEIKTLPASSLNVLDLLSYDQLIMTVAAIRKAEEIWTGEVSPRSMSETAVVEAQAPEQQEEPAGPADGESALESEE